MESLRLIPPAWLIHRRLTADHKPWVPGDWIGEDVFVSPLSAHYRGARALEYRPAQWARPGAEWPSNFMPFGLGRSRCLFSTPAIDLSTSFVEVLRRWVAQPTRIDRLRRIRSKPLLRVQPIRLLRRA